MVVPTILKAMTISCITKTTMPSDINGIHKNHGHRFVKEQNDLKQEEGNSLNI